MKYTKMFISRAIEGGWYKEFFKKPIDPCKPVFDSGMFYADTGTIYVVRLSYEAILLDPSSWRAVGKVEGWERKTIHAHFNYKEEAKVKMHGMIDALWDGKSIEQYLETLFKK